MSFPNDFRKSNLDRSNKPLNQDILDLTQQVDLELQAKMTELNSKLTKFGKRSIT